MDKSTGQKIGTGLGVWGVGTEGLEGARSGRRWMGWGGYTLQLLNILLHVLLCHMRVACGLRIISI